MTIYTNQATQAACNLLGMEYEKTYLDATLNGTPVRIFRAGTFIHIDLIDYDSLLILYEEPHIESVIDALFDANKDRVKIVDKIEEMSARYGSAEELAENNESERDGWFSWPSTTPPDDEECIVTFTEDGHARTLIGRYHSEFDLWVFPTLDKRVGTITKSDPAYSAVIYKPLEP